MNVIKLLVNKLRQKKHNEEYQRKYREKNYNNFTSPANMFDIDSVFIGKKTYGSIRVLGSAPGWKLKIGNYCSIAPDVTFIPCSDHYVNHISTYPFKVMVMHESSEAISKGDIVIDDDVWIGCGATILSGVHIGQGAIVAAGAVVSRDLPPYSLGGGVPAKILKFRFDEKTIRKLLTIDFSKLDEELIARHIDDLYSVVDDDSDLSWLPLKEGGC